MSRQPAARPGAIIIELRQPAAQWQSRFAADVQQIFSDDPICGHCGKDQSRGHSLLAIFHFCPATRWRQVISANDHTLVQRQQPAARHKLQQCEIFVRFLRSSRIVRRL